MFRCKFVGWEGVLREDYSVVKGEKKSTERKAPKVKHFFYMVTITHIIFIGGFVSIVPT